MADEHETYTDPNGFEVDLTDLAADIKKLEVATEYLTKKLQALNTITAHPMDRLVGGGAPPDDIRVHQEDFARKWTQAANRLLGKRTELSDSVKSFTQAMKDVYNTYSRAEGDNAGNFHSIANNY